MTPAERAAQLLIETESRLRELASQAVNEADYDSVVRIASWAASIGSLLKVSAPGPEHAPNSTKASARYTERKKPNVTHRRSVQHVRTKAEYPRFFREGTELVRVSWSKRKKQEYQHRAPFPVVRCIAETIGRIGADGRLFSTDRILPALENDGHEIPQYQLYVVIALLRQAGFIDQHGRKGYSVRRAQLKEALEQLWEKIPEHLSEVPK